MDTIIKDLGFHYTPSLHFDHRITFGKVLQILGFMLRNTKLFISGSCLHKLYLTLNHLIFEYGIIVWYSYLVKHLLRIKRVQK